MRDVDRSVPCYNNGKGCDRRCVTSTYNCHSNCPEYKAYQERSAKDRELLHKQRNADYAYIETRVKAAYKTAHKKRQQKAWGINK